MHESVAEGKSHRRPSRWPARLVLLLFLIAGAAAGYLSTKPLYRAQGLVQFRQPLSALHDQPGRPIDLPYIESEAMVARSPTIADNAMVSSNWNLLARPVSPASKEWFLQHVDAQPVAAGTMQISFIDPVPADAENACKAAVLAYTDYWKAHREQDESQRLAVLRDRVSLMAGTIVRLDTLILKDSRDAGGSDLSVMHNAQIEEIVRLEREIREAQNPVSAAAAPAAHAVPAYLTARYEQAKKTAEKTGQTMMKLDEFGRQRDLQAAELATYQHRIGELTLALNMTPSLSILTVANVSPTPAIDHRPRNAAVGALAALILFFILKSLLRNWRNHNHSQKARTAFPVIITHTPKPVVPIAEFTGLATT
jgi:uncharacterized protein involved in exopolysaccharide biosynthesis